MKASVTVDYWINTDRVGQQEFTECIRDHRWTKTSTGYWRADEAFFQLEVVQTACGAAVLAWITEVSHEQ